jgi:hypothetical protein
MEDIEVKVNDSNYVQTNVINNIKIKVNRLVLFTSVSLCVNLLNDNTLIDNKFFTLTGTDYTNWANDDTYIVTYVLAQLNLTKVPTVSTS